MLAKKTDLGAVGRLGLLPRGLERRVEPILGLDVRRDTQAGGLERLRDVADFLRGFGRVERGPDSRPRRVGGLPIAGRSAPGSPTSS